MQFVRCIEMKERIRYWDVVRGMAMLPVIGCISLLLSACSHSKIQEAKAVVQQADSLRAAGQYYSDSAALRTAAATLHPVRFFYPKSYSRACYHYGRLLIDIGQPVEAADYLVRAEQTACLDPDSRGRIYSNMAHICREAEYYEDAYTFNMLAADCFLHANDTVNYRYAYLYSAYDLGHMHQYDSAYSLLESCTINAPNHYLRAYRFSILAYVYSLENRNAEALSAIDSAYSYGMSTTSLLTIKARSFHHIGQLDSALFYAKKVATSDTNMHDLYSVYYILCNDNPDLEQDTLLAQVAYRADLGKEIENHKMAFTQAADVLLQSRLHSRKIIVWIGCGIIVIGLVAIGIVLATRRRRLRYKQELQAMQEHKIQMQADTQMLQQKKADYQSDMYAEVEQTCRLLRANPKLKDELHWDNYALFCQVCNNRFYRLIDTLQGYGTLKESDIRLCVLVLIGLSHKEIANVLNYSHLSIGQFKEKTATKLGVHGGALRTRLLQLMGLK